MRRISFSSIVYCARCTLPVRFGSAFWWRSPRRPDVLQVVCGGCVGRHINRNRLSRGNIEQTARILCRRREEEEVRRAA